LLTKSEWVQRREWLNQEVKDAEAKGDVDAIVKLNDQMEEIETRLNDEEGNVDSTRISDDLFLSLDAFLRFTGDPCAVDLPLSKT
jgi:flagellar basal body rod protein FlgG